MKITPEPLLYNIYDHIYQHTVPGRDSCSNASFDRNTQAIDI